MAIEDIPIACMNQCGDRYEAAIKQHAVHGEYDTYLQIVDDDECDHENTILEFSHEAVQAVDTSDARIYTIVDLCMGAECGIEYGEQAYTFNCGNN